MTKNDESTIQALESRLKNAMLTSDVHELDALLADDLIFTNHLGYLMSKQDDLNAHKSGMMSIEHIDIGDMRVKLFNDIALVNVEARIIGTFNGDTSENTFRFSRVWCRALEDKWQVSLAHSSLVV